MRELIVIACVLVALTGCSTSLGYVPHYVPPAEMTTRTGPVRPSYTDVKLLAYEQIHGYLVSGRINRDSLYAGALTAGVSVTAMAALAIFAPGSPALTAIPLAGGLLGGTMAVMQSEQKTVIYLRAAALVMAATLNSDKRLVRTAVSQDEEALCLREDLYRIDALVAEHVMALSPQGVADRLRAIGPGNPQALADLARAATDYGDLLSSTPACPVAGAPAAK